MNRDLELIQIYEAKIRYYRLYSLLHTFKMQNISQDKYGYIMGEILKVEQEINLLCLAFQEKYGNQDIK